LLQGEEWKSSKPQICRLLERSTNAIAELEALAQQLDEAYRQTAANFADNGWVRIDCVAGKETLVLKGLEKLDEPPSLVSLRTTVERLLPRADLPEVLLEIQARTGFASEFTHISDSLEKGFWFHDVVISTKQQLPIRRIKLKQNQQVDQLRPDFVMPYMVGKTDEIDKPMYLRQFGVPFEAIAYV
jgi:hypothetical protein